MVSKVAGTHIADNLSAILGRVSVALQQTTKTSHCKLLAVSKTKPNEDIIAAYEAG